MTFYQFQLLTPRAQLLHVLTAGTYLAHRWETERRVNLYHLPDAGQGFFVEVGYDKDTLETQVLHSFRSSGPLEDYAHEVRLPEE